MKQTLSTKSQKASDIVRRWHLVDVDGAIVGRAATGIATKLQGKQKVNYVDYLDCGDYVVVVNAKNVKFTGRKLEAKIYTRYSGYPGGLTEQTAQEVKDTDPTLIIKNAVSRMLPKNKHRDPRMSRLFVYAGADHPYAQKLDGNKS